jgi:hypothetical protein
MFWGPFEPFHYYTKVDAKWAEQVPLTQKCAKRSWLGFFATNAIDPLYWTKNSCFGVFQTVSLLHESQFEIGQTGAINAQVR